MKISSVSKKVLASALSAAMVVAFAPTVAFGADGDAVTVTIDADGGTATITSYPYAKEGTAFTLGDATKDGYSLANWWYDADGDGKVGNDETYKAGASFTPTKSAVTLKAIYAMPTVSVTATTPGSGITGEIVAALGTSNVKKDATYTLTITNPSGTVVRTEEFKPATDGPDKGYATLADVKVDFVANPLSTEKEQVRDSLLISGVYTVALSDGASTIASETVELVTVKTSNKLENADPATTTELVYWLADGKATATLPSLPEGQSWLDADGYAVNTSVSVTKDASFTATDTPQYVYSSGYIDYNRAIAFEVVDSKAADEDIFAIEVKDPSGVTVYTGEISGKDVSYYSFGAFSFDQKSPIFQHALNNATEKAGTYAITVTKTAKDGTVTSSKTKAVLTQVVYDAGEGTFATGSGALTADQKSYFVDGTDGEVDLPAATVVTPAEGYHFTKWTLNGKEYAASTADVALKAGEVNTIKAAYAKDVITNVAAPTVVSASYDATKKEYTVKLATATAGAKIQYKIGDDEWKDYTAAGVVFKSGDAVQAQTLPVAGSSDPTLKDPSAAVVISVDQSTFTNLVKGKDSYLEEYVGFTKVKYLEQDGIKAAIAAGQAALDAQVADTEKNWTKLVTAQVKGVYDAVAAFANAELAKYADGALVVVGEKAYTIDAKTLATEQKAIKAITDGIAKEETDKTIDAAKYTTAVNNIVTALNNDLKGANESKTVTAADIKAAADVTAALKGATTGAEAEAALEAYTKLTDVQKKLIDAADVAAAQKVASEAKAQAELVNTQDLAAVKYVNNPKTKTVKLATAKKKGATITYRSQVSKSGHKVTYKKVSGSSKIKVAKAGKVTLAKVAKKGTYKAKVKVTCGTQTRNVTVKFIVK